MNNFKYTIYPTQEGLQQHALTESLFSPHEIQRLGQLADLALQFARIQQTKTPSIHAPHLIILAADHGVIAQKEKDEKAVSSTKWAIEIARGMHAINALCRQHQFAMRIVDVGLVEEPPPSLGITRLIRAAGTGNLFDGETLSQEHMNDAIRCGEQLARESHEQGCNLLAIGSVSSGARLSSALVAERLSGIPFEHSTCEAFEDELKLANQSNETLRHLLESTPRARKKIDCIARFGGFELAVAMGILLKAAEFRMTTLIDSFPMLIALLAAKEINPAVSDYAMLTHMEQNTGMQEIAKHIGIIPILRLGMQNTEGIGALTVYPILQSALSLLRITPTQIGR